MRQPAVARAAARGAGARGLTRHTTAAQTERKPDVVAYDDVRIEVISEGAGPLVVLLPSRGRNSEDFDDIAAGIAKSGFRVLRPQPRGAGERFTS